MSDNAGAVTASSSASAPSSSNAITAGAVASANGGGGETTSSTVSSLEDLRKKSPKVYNMMMQGIGMNICREMEHHQDRLKELMRDGRADAGG